MSFRFFTTTIAILLMSFNLWAGNEDILSGTEAGNGGFFVLIDGEWVAWDEANEYLTEDYFSLLSLSKADCFGNNGCKQSTYGKAVSPWLYHLEKYQPELAKKLRANAAKLRFRMVNYELSVKPSEIPQSDIHFKDIIKAAHFQHRSDTVDQVLISIPAMNMAGQLGSKRLTPRENQGWLLFHELLNSELGKELTPTQIADYGLYLLRAWYKKWDLEEYRINIGINGIPVLLRQLTAEQSFKVIQFFEEKDLLGDIPLMIPNVTLGNDEWSLMEEGVIEPNRALCQVIKEQIWMERQVQGDQSQKSVSQIYALLRQMPFGNDTREEPANASIEFPCDASETRVDKNIFVSFYNGIRWQNGLKNFRAFRIVGKDQISFSRPRTPAGDRYIESYTRLRDSFLKKCSSLDEITSCLVDKKLNLQYANGRFYTEDINRAHLYLDGSYANRLVWISSTYDKDRWTTFYKTPGDENWKQIKGRPKGTYIFVEISGPNPDAKTKKKKKKKKKTAWGHSHEK